MTSPALDFAFSMAFQPVVRLSTATVYAQEALVRGPEGECSASVLERVTAENRYRFDQACRVCAIEAAARLGVDSYLSINFLPNAVYRPEQCIRTTLRAAEFYGFPIERIIFEFSEGEYVNDRDHLRRIVESYRQFGFLTALDDFGARYAGLGLLADFQPDLVKLDMHLIRGIDHCPARRTIVSGTLEMCRRLGCEVVAEGVETSEELAALRGLGVDLVQGYLFAPPVFQGLAEVDLSGVRVLDGTDARAV